MQFTTYLASAVLGFVAFAAAAPASGSEHISARQANFAKVDFWYNEYTAGSSPSSSTDYPLGTCRSIGVNRVRAIAFSNLPSTYECRVYKTPGGCGPNNCNTPNPFIFRGTTGIYIEPTFVDGEPLGRRENCISCSTY